LASRMFIGCLLSSHGQESGHSVLIVGHGVVPIHDVPPGFPISARLSRLFMACFSRSCDWGCCLLSSVIVRDAPALTQPPLPHDVCAPRNERLDEA
jgi:hypothetical protein